ncbi:MULTISPECIES: YggS family pyridoxal phosphate-dependent enzyme [unclassified Granulicatella]|uniref:YggS family pyridoxal phosphate-dependent enzyme n=1 Tax=unclassified Granulicatella TaxID=2630493 RepID=UPI0010741320|nr:MULTISPECIES: YggS family pyridoxal phosphate-dependent enzyme [unclassified Granulicatella]MBF0780416.1 YggS family pyridoxal phosphate-dependent enzyme [Granulicatella sp. 19428wC4_WM01]TFU95453.1 YggS family pyridoxal phosphate-dependent enzyme [Granulicatella sp. WM01]
MIKNIECIQDNCKKALLKSPYNQVPQIIVVTKQQLFEDISKLYQKGFTHFAENRVEALLDRQKEFPQTDITWHLIGTLQTRKVKHIINKIDYFHALDRFSLIDEIEKRAEKTIRCFLQVNVFQEESKHGFSIHELEHVVSYIKHTEHIEIVGLMAMAPFQMEYGHIRQGFAQLKKQQELIHQLHIKQCPCLYTSMGMSQDYTIALEEGATHLRIGSAFFRK